MNNTDDKPGVALRLVGQYDPTAVHTHLRACEQITRQYSEVILERFFAALDQRFDTFLERAGSNDEQGRIIDTLQLLRGRRGELLESFLNNVSEGFTLFANQQLDTRIAQAPQRPERLTLIDNDVLEENIALSSISYRTEDVVRADLWFLSQRLAVLNSGRKVRDNNNPLSPLRFCHVLRATFADQPIPIREKLLAYKLFESVLHESYPALLTEINDYLAGQGVLPNLRLLDGAGPLTGGGRGGEGGEGGEGAEQLPSSPPSQNAENTDQGLGAGAGLDYDAIVIQAIHTLQRYLQQGGLQHGGPGTTAPLSAPRSPAYSGQQLIDVLHAVQNQTLAAAESIGETSGSEGTVPIAENLKRAIVAQLRDEGSNGELDPADMHTIDLVGMIFEYMLSDEQLPDSVKTLLSYLHTPLLKIAFLDAGFFEQKDHPARLLLNALADAGTRWVGNDGTSQYDMFAKIKEVVFRVLEEFENDVRLFAELLLEFGAHVKKIARQQDLMEKRAMERFQGEERLREVKVRVNREVRARIDGKELPSAVLLLLLQPWSDYLAFLLLRYGDESASWTQALRAVDDIIVSVQASTGSAATRKYQARQERVLGTVRSGLSSIGYDQNRGEKMLDALRSLQQMALERKQAAPAPPPVRTRLETEAAQKAGDQLEPEEKISAEERRMVEHLKMIEFGTWFEFEGGKRVKVAWYNSKNLHYMLVNQMGREVALKSGLELARDMLAGRARVIAGSAKPFFERALENILQNLNAKAVQGENDNG